MRRFTIGAALSVASSLLLLLSATATADPGSAPVSAVSGTSAALATGCCTRTDPPAVYDHVVLLVFENKDQDQVFASGNAPYLQSLADACGRASNMHEQVSEPSLANYLALTAGNLGSPATITAFIGPKKAPQDSDSLFERLGRDWREISEDATQNCQMFGAGEYAVGHAPSLYFPRVASACATQHVPMVGAPDLSARFTLLTPNLKHIMHEDNAPGTTTTAQRVSSGDSWAAGYLPAVFSSAEYQSGRTVVIITWDEGSSSRSDIPFIVISPYTPAGYRTNQYFDHYSTLKGIQRLLGMSKPLGHAADPGVVSVGRFFGLR